METSYNGWTASRTVADFGGLTELRVGTETFPPGVRSGDVHTVLSYVATALDARVEPVAFPGGHPADDWGYSYRPNKNNARVLSCHASGTAFDYNATRHPNGKRGTFTAAQVAEIRRILAEVGGAVRWGGDFTGTPDEMHFEVIASPATLALIADRLRRKGATGSTTTAPPTEEDDMTPTQAAQLQRVYDITERLLTEFMGPAEKGVPALGGQTLQQHLAALPRKVWDEQLPGVNGVKGGQLTYGDVPARTRLGNVDTKTATETVSAIVAGAVTTALTAQPGGGDYTPAELQAAAQAGVAAALAAGVVTVRVDVAGHPA